MDIIKDIYNRSEPSNLFIASPGKRIITFITGIDESTISLKLNFQNTHQLTFDVYRFIDEEENQSYQYIDRLMEIHVENFGWFKIMEYPEVYYSGEKDERKTVVAESLEIELTGTDLTGFVVNAVTEQSLEILAEDNSYESDYGLTLYRDWIVFYRDLTNYEIALTMLTTSSTESDLKEILSIYPEIFKDSWRIRVGGEDLRENLQAGINYYESEDVSVTALKNLYSESINWTEDQWNNQLKKTSILNLYPKLLNFFELDINYVYEEETLSPYELLQLEYRRLKDLSLLDLILKTSPGWTVGYVDTELYEEYNSSLADSVGRFEINSQSIYAFLTQDVAKYFSCIFTFDTYNCKVNAYRVNTIGKNTNILLGYENIVNDITVSSTYDLITKYYVYGSDYGINYVNFGSSYIEDLSYFLNTKYMPQSLIDKYNEWYEYRESVRNTYVDYTRQYNTQLTKRNEIKNRVPDDGMDNVQWGSMGDEQLQTTLEDYEALIKGYENYYIDEDGNFDITALQSVPSDYEHYLLIKNVIIPNINIELSNRNVTSSEEQDFWDETGRNYIYTITGDSDSEVETLYNNLVSRFGIEYENDGIVQGSPFYMQVTVGFFVIYGELYGLDELQIQVDNFTSKIKALEKAGYGSIDDDSTDYAKSQYQLYLDHKNTLQELNVLLEERQIEYDKANEKLKEINFSRTSLVKDVDKTNTSGEHFTAFTEEELNILNKFYYISDYTNDNIITTSLDDTITTIDIAEELYQDAIEQLYVESHPQLTYSTNVDNFLSLIKYAEFAEELNLADFIRIETEEDYFIKLRLISIEFNPLCYDESISLTFSDMIKYKFKRNDFINLLNNSSFSSKNSSSIISSNSNSENVLSITADVIKQIVNNSYFQSAINSGISGTGSGSGETIFSEAILADYIKVNELNAELAKIDHLESNSAFITYLNSELITADKIYTTMLEADSAYVENLAAKMSQFMKISASNITGVDAEFAKLVAGQITVNDLKASVLTLGSGVAIENEEGTFIIDSTGLNIYGTDSEGNSYCGIQLGYDTENNPSLILRDSEGALLLTPDGITENAIVDELIVTRMIASEAVTGDKIDWSTCGATTDENGNVIWNINSLTYNDEEFSSVMTRIETQLAENTEKIQEVEDNVTWKLEIMSSNGMILDRTNPTTTLYAQLYKGSENVTSEYQNSLYWTRQSTSEESDTTWNTAHEAPGYYVQISRADIVRSAQFTCEFIQNDEVLASQTI